VRVPVEHGDQRRRTVGREHAVEHPAGGLVEPAAALQRPEQQAGAGHADHIGGQPERVQALGGGERLGHQRPHGGEGDDRPGGPAQRVGAGDDLATAELAGGRVGRDGGQRLVHRAGGQPQVGRGPAGPAQQGQRSEQAPLGVEGERRLVRDAARLLQADGRRGDRLVRTALGGQRHARRRPDEERLPARVDAERPRLQRPLDERVVEHTDRQQRLPPAAPGRAQLTDGADQVGLGDAQLDVLAGGALAPVQDRLGVVGEPVAPVLV
jgi:hypothetical protein